MGFQFSMPKDRIAMKRGVAVLCIILLICAAVLYLTMLQNAIRTERSQDVVCVGGYKPNVNQNSYIELQISDQDPTEPFFRGNFFISLSDREGKAPEKITVMTSGRGQYAGNLDEVEMVRNEEFQATYMKKRETTDFDRISGSHKDFSFDSAAFDFELST